MSRGSLARWLASAALIVAAACSASPEPAGSSSPAGPSATAVDPVFAAGEAITISPTGPEPRTLIAVSGVDIVFRNESGRPVRLVANGGVFDSGKIPVGGSWTFRPDAAVTITYQAGSDSGTIQVDPAAGEGEIPGATPA